MPLLIANFSGRNFFRRRVLLGGKSCEARNVTRMSGVSSQAHLGTHLANQSGKARSMWARLERSSAGNQFSQSSAVIRGNLRKSSDVWKRAKPQRLKPRIPDRLGGPAGSRALPEPTQR
jgi:hypothetical protein